MMIIARSIFFIILLLNLYACTNHIMPGDAGAKKIIIEDYVPASYKEREDLQEKVDIHRELHSRYHQEIPIERDYSSKNYEEDYPITTDTRIKTYVYNPNGVYLLIVHFGFQSHIEFSQGEEVESIILGDSFAWKITPLENRLFINPLEKNIRTNMTVITNKKRSYQFDIVSKELEDGYDSELVYAVRFYYPKKRTK